MRADAVVGVGLALVGEVAGEDDRLGPAAGCLELVEELAQVLVARDPVVQLAAAREEVRVADVEQEVIRPRIFGRPGVHGDSVSSRSPNGLWAPTLAHHPDPNTR